ncbi:hypothetical protein B0T24DRAFT_642322 [Lasiosphaeria ovina]|uniref:Uncharacterized protein n=1 Tax=Lasiosphaeria ovina TaxID=92902 RepID=A0AAE0JTD0_9PEZI|nr:hypothetical protein B0T24DRAFT_642322 [Lasiosphaeria ovina]
MDLLLLLCRPAVGRRPPRASSSSGSSICSSSTLSGRWRLLRRLHAKSSAATMNTVPKMEAITMPAVWSEDNLLLLVGELGAGTRASAGFVLACPGSVDVAVHSVEGSNPTPSWVVGVGVEYVEACCGVSVGNVGLGDKLEVGVVAGAGAVGTEGKVGDETGAGSSESVLVLVTVLVQNVAGLPINGGFPGGTPKTGGGSTGPWRMWIVSLFSANSSLRNAALGGFTMFSRPGTKPSLLRRVCIVPGVRL